MDIKEAYEILNVTDEEISSIKHYLAFRHVSINILCDFNPDIYNKLEKVGWYMSQTSESLEEDINDFVNIYSAMCKTSHNKKPINTLIRGTSNTRISEISNTISSFISTSTDEYTAESFVEYGDPAVIYFKLNGNVPFLDSSLYRDENSKDEHEILLSPFCKVVSPPQKIPNYKNSFKKYAVTIEKGDLEYPETEDLSSLKSEILEAFPQRLSDIKQLNSLKDLLAFYDYKCSQNDIDEEDKTYILIEKKRSQEEYDKLSASTLEFGNKLQTLLKGLCKQAEITINNALTITAEDMKRKQQEDQAKKELEQKLSKVSELRHNITDSYMGFLGYEKQIDALSKKFNFSFDRGISNTQIPSLVKNLTEKLTSIFESYKISEKNAIENSEIIDNTNPNTNNPHLLDSINYGIEISKNFPVMQKLYMQQLDNESKKMLYNKVHNTFQDILVQKYMREKQSIENEPVGVFGKLFGKNTLKEQRIENINLRIQLAKSSVPKVHEKYSVREILADMHIFANTQLSGNFTQEMNDLYELIKSNYQDTNIGRFTEEYIRSIAKQKMINETQSKSELAMLPPKSSRIFGTTKNQINFYKNQNNLIRQELYSCKKRNLELTITNPTNDALAIFEQQLQAVSNILNNSKETTKERENNTLENTLDLWS